MMRPRHNNRSIGCVLATLSLLFAGMALAQQTTAPAALPPASIAVAGGVGADWLVRPAADEDGKARWSVLRRAQPSSDGMWIAVATLNELPTSIAAFGERLAVVYADGAWAIIAPGSQIAGPSPPAGYKLEVVQTAGDSLLTFLARLPSSTSPKFIDFDGSKFSAPRGVELPSTRPAALEQIRSVHDAATTSDGTIFASRSENVVGVVKLDDGRQTIVHLDPAAMKQRLTISRDADGSPRFWWTNGDHVWSQAFSMDGGTAKGNAEEVVIRPPPTPTLFERALYAVGALTLVLVLFAGGRQTIATGRALAAKAPPKPAPLARRLAAGIIDAVPLAGCVAYLAVGNKLTIFAGLLHFDGIRSEAILTAGVLFYLVLLATFELQWQRSIGKAIFALRVVALDGGKPRPAAVLLRNVLRLVDLNLITLLFVPMTPLRQRLGDFLAGTMVVDDLDADATATARVTPDERTDK